MAAGYCGLLKGYQEGKEIRAHGYRSWKRRRAGKGACLQNARSGDRAYRVLGLRGRVASHGGGRQFQLRFGWTWIVGNVRHCGVGSFAWEGGLAGPSRPEGSLPSIYNPRSKMVLAQKKWKRAQVVGEIILRNRQKKGVQCLMLKMPGIRPVPCF